MEIISPEILCFTTSGLIFQHNHSMRGILIQEQLCMPQEALEIICWPFATVPIARAGPAHVLRLIHKGISTSCNFTFCNFKKCICC